MIVFTILKYRVQSFFESTQRRRVFTSITLGFGFVVACIAFAADVIPNFQQVLVIHLYSATALALVAFVLAVAFASFGIFEPADVRGGGMPNNEHLPRDIYAVGARFARKDDMLAIHGIAETWFPRDILIGSTRMRKWLTYEPNCFRVFEVLSSSNKNVMIYGYYAILPLSIGVYSMIRSGVLLEKDVDIQHICHFSDPGADVLYLVDIAKHSGIGRFQGWGMTADLVCFIEECLSQNRNIKKIGAWALLPGGRRLAERLGLQCVKTYRDGSRFYEITSEKFREQRADKSTLMGRFDCKCFSNTYTVRI